MSTTISPKISISGNVQGMTGMKPGYPKLKNFQGKYLLKYAKPKKTLYVGMKELTKIYNFCVLCFSIRYLGKELHAFKLEDFEKMRQYPHILP